MIPSIVVTIGHATRPGEQPEIRDAVADVLARPAFGSLRRVARGVRGRAVGHAELDRDRIAAYLAGEACDPLILDSGRSGELTALASIDAGRRVTAWDSPGPVPVSSFAILPYDGTHLAEILAAFLDLARALRAVSGFVTVEPTLGMAQTAALVGQLSPRARARHPALTDRHVRERGAAWVYDRELDRRIGGPEWGTFLGAGHLAALPLAELERSGVFARVVVLDEALVFVQLTEDPLDVLDPAFETRLDAARVVLAPIMLDSRNVPLKGGLREP